MSLACGMCVQCYQCLWIVRSFLIAQSNVASVYGLSVHSWLPDPMLPVSMDCPFILDCPIQCCQCRWIVRSFLIARSNVSSVYGLSVHSWTCSFINTCWQFLLLSWRLIRYNFLNVGDGWKCVSSTWDPIDRGIGKQFNSYIPILFQAEGNDIYPITMYFILWHTIVWTSHTLYLK